MCLFSSYLLYSILNLTFSIWISCHYCGLFSRKATLSQGIHSFPSRFTTAISSYLINVVDGFLTEFWIILLIILQCIIFTWFYDIENVIPILNENNRLKVGKTWVFILKYILPVFLLFLWISGVYKLALDSNNFEITIYILITALILIVSYIFTNIDKTHD